MTVGAVGERVGGLVGKPLLPSLIGALIGVGMTVGAVGERVGGLVGKPLLPSLIGGLVGKPLLPSLIGGLIGGAIVGEVGMTLGADVWEWVVRFSSLTHSQHFACLQKFSLLLGQRVEAIKHVACINGSEDGIQPVGSRIGGSVGKLLLP